jgi:hypothetical protein
MICGYGDELHMSKSICGVFRAAGGRAEQIHHKAHPGMPDLIWTVHGWIGWLELKLVRRIGGLHTQARLGFTDQQLKFLSDWHKCGVPVGLYVLTDREWFGLNGGALVRVGNPHTLAWADWLGLATAGQSHPRHNRRPDLRNVLSFMLEFDS